MGVVDKRQDGVLWRRVAIGFKPKFQGIEQVF